MEDDEKCHDCGTGHDRSCRVEGGVAVCSMRHTSYVSLPPPGLSTPDGRAVQQGIH